ncbi:hypothetical protein SAMN02927937_00169 [Paenimyroides aquimaris]|uniref:Tetratricopeptide repeat protein n=1 Tax=Paenimyroides marinum TaxID=1159016 RepID=A0A1H6J8I5_9FLAO|nr:hypothetical protein [Paenimyroides aquimaris]SEH55257.1 hypothetical protein SAMN02927937_00169 [Paenimyroides aquimaris]
MKKYLLFLLIVISTQTISSQSKFSNGFRNGYKEGYCHNQGIGCLSPNPPIAPIPNVNESINSYQDGYNRGFERGLSAQKTNSNSTQTRERYKTAEPGFVDNFTYQPNYDLQLYSIKVTADALVELNKKSLESLDNGDYDKAIYYSDKYIGISNRLKLKEHPAPFSIKAIAYINKSEYLNSYNNLKKSQLLGFDDNMTINMITNITEDYLKKQMEKNYYSNVKYFCEHVWYPNNYTNYFLGLSNYYLRNFKEAKKALKKVNDFEPAETYLKAIKNKEDIPNPFLKKTLPKKNTKGLWQELIYNYDNK